MLGSPIWTHSLPFGSLMRVILVLTSFSRYKEGANDDLRRRPFIKNFERLDSGEYANRYVLFLKQKLP